MEHLVNTDVIHTTYGKGKITQVHGTMITVHFREHGDKKFQYPDAFDKYLKVVDIDLAATVADDLECNKREIAEVQRKALLVREEKRRLEEEEKAQVAAAKKKSPKGTTKRSTPAEKR